MPLQPLPLPVSYAYTDQVRNSGGYLINMECEAAPDDARTPATLIGSPGLAVFANTGLSPVLDMVEVNSACYAITGAGIYRVFPDGGVFKLGIFSLTPQARASSNGLAIVAVDGKRIWSYTIQPDEAARYASNTPFTDFAVELTNTTGYHPANTVTFLDGYLIFDRAGTNQFYNTMPFSLTADPLAFSSAETRPDFVVAVREHQQQLLIVSQTHFEVWSDAGSGSSPFIRVPSAVGDDGTSAPYTVTGIKNTSFWLNQNGSVVAMNGYSPAVISNQAVEDAIAQRDTTFAYAFCYEANGHIYYQLTVEDFTCVYDLSTQKWHVRQDYDYGHHRANCFCFAFGKHLVGSFRDGILYDMDRAYLDNAGRPLVATIVSGPVVSGGDTQFFASVELMLDVGFGNDAIPSPTVTMEISDDDGRTWWGHRNKPLGEIGKYGRRVRWKRNGRSSNRRFRWTISDPVKRSLPARFWAEVS